MRTEDKIRALIAKYNLSEEFTNSLQSYIYDLIDESYNLGYNDRKCGKVRSS